MVDDKKGAVAPQDLLGNQTVTIPEIEIKDEIACLNLMMYGVAHIKRTKGEVDDAYMAKLSNWKIEPVYVRAKIVKGDLLEIVEPTQYRKKKMFEELLKDLDRKLQTKEITQDDYDYIKKRLQWISP